MSDRLVIRSYPRVFRVDRRIHRVDRWTLPVPGGVPLRGAAYFGLAVGVVVLLGALPGSGVLVGLISAPLRFVVLPLLVAVLAMQATPDGRPAHRFAWDWLRLKVWRPRRCAGRRVAHDGQPVRWAGVLATRWDEHAPELRHGRVHGPVKVTFAVPIALSSSGGRLHARSQGDGKGGASVVLCSGQSLEVRS